MKTYKVYFDAPGDVRQEIFTLHSGNNITEALDNFKLCHPALKSKNVEEWTKPSEPSFART